LTTIICGRCKISNVDFKTFGGDEFGPFLNSETFPLYERTNLRNPRKSLLCLEGIGAPPYTDQTARSMGQTTLTAWVRRRCSFTLASTNHRFVSFGSGLVHFLRCLPSRLAVLRKEDSWRGHLLIQCLSNAKWKLIVFCSNYILLRDSTDGSQRIRFQCIVEFEHHNISSHLFKIARTLVNQNICPAALTQFCAQHPAAVQVRRVVCSQKSHSARNQQRVRSTEQTFQRQTRL
jgi:hypothetical protein